MTNGDRTLAEIENDLFQAYAEPYEAFVATTLTEEQYLAEVVKRRKALPADARNMLRHILNQPTSSDEPGRPKKRKSDVQVSVEEYERRQRLHAGYSDFRRRIGESAREVIERTFLTPYRVLQSGDRTEETIDAAYQQMETGMERLRHWATRSEVPERRLIGEEVYEEVMESISLINLDGRKRWLESQIDMARDRQDHDSADGFNDELGIVNELLEAATFYKKEVARRDELRRQQETQPPGSPNETLPPTDRRGFGDSPGGG